mmetsp:Transcript_46512/g.95137  ORF Transcript_46512/g.95137 Transcript_46512/m.95137 type:complete len:166 (-) Transcript_46512:4210-4707(-)
MSDANPNEQKKQHDPNKYPIFNGQKSGLETWEVEAKFYLENTDQVSWVLERDAATRNAILAANAAWTNAEKIGDQDKGFQLLWHTFKGTKKNILDCTTPGVGLWCTDTWKEIWKDFMGEKHLEIAELLNGLLAAKKFSGEFRTYIDKIDTIHQRMTELGAEAKDE